MGNLLVKRPTNTKAGQQRLDDRVLFVLGKNKVFKATEPMGVNANNQLTKKVGNDYRSQQVQLSVKRLMKKGLVTVELSPRGRGWMSISLVEGAEVPAEEPVERMKCQECGKEFNRKGLGQHMRQVHNIYGGVSGKIRPEISEMHHVNRLRKEQEEAVAKPPNGRGSGGPRPVREIINPRNAALGAQFSVAEGFLILEDNQGGVWLAERIK